MIVRDARTLKFDSNRPVFFDTNVWLSIFHPATSEEAQKDWARDYSDFYARLVKYKVPIVVNAMVMSEYINRFCRIEHEAYCKAYKFVEYKDFRNSKDFSYVASAAAGGAGEILGTSSVCREGIEKDLDIHGFVAAFETGHVDFNDSVYIAICLKNGWPIVTNDSDFATCCGDLEVWTTNDSILRRARKNGTFKSR